jgi:aromatic ring-opening dioxygenase catalytic subunit (LigB family)
VPEARRNHRNDAHLLPLFVALGAAQREVWHLKASTTHAIRRMDAYTFRARGSRGLPPPPLRR